jgi:hypothetical protein
VKMASGKGKHSVIQCAKTKYAKFAMGVGIGEGCCVCKATADRHPGSEAEDD